MVVTEMKEPVRGAPAACGIVPTLALESHAKQLPVVVRETLRQSKMKVTELDAIAVTRGPGIHACLSVGMNAAKTLAAALE